MTLQIFISHHYLLTRIQVRPSLEDPMRTEHKCDITSVPFKTRQENEKYATTFFYNQSLLYLSRLTHGKHIYYAFFIMT